LADLPASLAGVRYLTVAEMATTLCVSKMTVYRLIHEGELAPLRIGRDFRIPVSAALAYLRSCQYTDI
jgi:excisionase family DNA binding protein